MTEQPTALRLADLLEKAPARTLEDGTITLYLGGTVVADKAAAELRRLSAENEALRRERDLLLGALKSTRAFINSVAPYGGLLERVNAAIKAVEGEKT